MQAEVCMMKGQNKHTQMRFGSCSCFNQSPPDYRSLHTGTRLIKWHCVGVIFQPARAMIHCVIHYSHTQALSHFKANANNCDFTFTSILNG